MPAESQGALFIGEVAIAAPDGCIILAVKDGGPRQVVLVGEDLVLVVSSHLIDTVLQVSVGLDSVVVVLNLHVLEGPVESNHLEVLAEGKKRVAASVQTLDLVKGSLAVFIELLLSKHLGLLIGALSLGVMLGLVLHVLSDHFEDIGLLGLVVVLRPDS